MLSQLVLFRGAMMKAGKPSDPPAEDCMRAGRSSVHHQSTDTLAAMRIEATSHKPIVPDSEASSEKAVGSTVDRRVLRFDESRVRPRDLRVRARPAEIIWLRFVRENLRRRLGAT